jgi:hypothetical protein
MNDGAEEWRPIPGWECAYEVSSHGRVRSLARIVIVRGRSDGQTSKQVRGRILKASLSDGRPVVNLRSDDMRRHALVHHLVLEAFVGPRPDGQECRHLDDNRQHNKLSNLEWGTRLENMDDRRRNSLRKRGARGEANNAAKLTEEDVLLIRRLRAGGLSYEKIGRQVGVSWQTVSRAAKGETWGWLNDRTDSAHMALEAGDK